MSEFNDGGPAFPAHDYVVGDINDDGFQKLGESRGMTLRDYFAAKAMQGRITGINITGNGAHDDIARLAYLIADAMLKERLK